MPACIDSLFYFLPPSPSHFCSLPHYSFLPAHFFDCFLVVALFCCCVSVSLTLTYMHSGLGLDRGHGLVCSCSRGSVRVCSLFSCRYMCDCVAAICPPSPPNISPLPVTTCHHLFFFPQHHCQNPPLPPPIIHCGRVPVWCDSVPCGGA